MTIDADPARPSHSRRPAVRRRQRTGFCASALPLHRPWRIFGFITKAAWVPYFGVVGIPEPWAWRLMPIVGTADVLAEWPCSTPRVRCRSCT